MGLMKPYNIVRFCRAFELQGFMVSGKVLPLEKIGGDINGKDT